MFRRPVVVLLAVVFSATACATAAGVVSRAGRLDHSNQCSNCGVSFGQLRQINMRYADRGRFEGDRPAAERDRARARRAVLPVIPKHGLADPNRVSAALQRAGFDPDEIQVSNDAVDAAGETAFGIDVDGGCVWGRAANGRLSVQITGYINDGGCLALYGH